jgi:tRNA (guanine-N7-)-methyltransferase
VTDPTSNAATTAQEIGDILHPRIIKSFVRRAGRTTAGQSRAMAEIGPSVLLPYSPVTIDLVAAYAHIQRPAAQNPINSDGNSANRPVVLEIGFGMGEATAQIAATLPGTNFLCCEVHEPGVGALLKRIGEQNLTNIRIIAHDAVEVIDHMLTPQCLDGIHIFFPDPWHKKRHNKRRLIQPALVAKLATRLKPGGYLHCATDWQPYAEQILDVLRAEPSLENTVPNDADSGENATTLGPGYAPKPFYRPLTKFENRGIKLGHGVWDVVFKRRTSLPG